MQNYVLIQKETGFGDKIQISIHVEPEAEVQSIKADPPASGGKMRMYTDWRKGGRLGTGPHLLQGADLVYLVGRTTALVPTESGYPLYWTGGGRERSFCSEKYPGKNTDEVMGSIWNFIYSRPGGRQGICGAIPRSFEGGGDDGKLFKRNWG